MRDKRGRKGQEIKGKPRQHNGGEEKEKAQKGGGGGGQTKTRKGRRNLKGVLNEERYKMGRRISEKGWVLGQGASIKKDAPQKKKRKEKKKMAQQPEEAYERNVGSL